MFQGRVIGRRWERELMPVSRERRETPWVEQVSSIRLDRYYFHVMEPTHWRENLVPIILILT